MHVVAVKRLTRSQRRSRIEDPLFASELDAHGPSFNFFAGSHFALVAFVLSATSDCQQSASPL
ncbi:hypothetical protein XH99_35365 [Bradyrhizobium nanningense]|uniref:Uncharacterized protein n=1 Tax=Bradyrhizobium nanningense TaxID=1325118 RepID=A0A4V1L0Y2_9BRAD|nr:hypothetical protein XH99_35365 [Bradyrhizobium nanningense]RXH28447.1 hypothetical protein XH84_26005 [Bradyrhizobium nanningense]